MAKKKKNIRNINTGDTVQFLNYLTPDHILRGKYNTGNNELDITDVPANLNSVITLGQGGGGGSIPMIELTMQNNYGEDLPTYSFNGETFVALTLPNGESAVIYDLYLMLEDNTCILATHGYDSLESADDLVNCTFVHGHIVITDPTKNASASVVYTYPD